MNMVTAKELVNHEHNIIKISNDVESLTSLIKGCKTVEQLKNARNYVNNWYTLVRHDEHLEDYNRLLVRILCRLNKRNDHKQCIVLVNDYHRALMKYIDTNIELFENIECYENNQ